MRMTLNFKGVQVYLHNHKRHLEIILSVRPLKQLALLALSLHGGLFRFYWFCLTTCIKHALDVYVFVCKVSYQNFVSKASRSELKFWHDCLYVHPLSRGEKKILISRGRVVVMEKSDCRDWAERTTFLDCPSFSSQLAAYFSVVYVFIYKNNYYI